MRRVELVIEPGQSLGLMIRGGVEYNLGIYVTGVDKDSVADRAGLCVSRLEILISLGRGKLLCGEFTIRFSYLTLK